MTKEELAAKLHGREYRNEITSNEEQLARAEGLLVVFGSSDDLCEFRGAIRDEVGAFNGTTVCISRDGGLLPQLDTDDFEVLRKYGVLGEVQRRRSEAVKVEAKWCKTPEFSWTFETSAPHATFDIMEDGEGYCRGIVLDFKELAGGN